MPNVQRNLRVPADQKDLIHEAARRLREDDGFAERLRALLEDVEAGSSADVRERLDALEARLDALEQAGAEVDVVQTDIEDLTGANESEKLVKRHGRGWRLTDAGKRVAVARLRADYSRQEVADYLGVTASAIGQLARKHGL